MKTKSTKIAILIMTLAIFTFPGSIIYAQDQNQDKGAGNCVRDFIDEDGDGFNDLAPDHDNDGIPNGQDEDYVRPLDGTGNKFGDGGNQGEVTQFRVGNRHTIMETQGQPDNDYGQEPHNGFGPGDGLGNDGEGPGDGTGNGLKKGDCPETNQGGIGQ